MEDVRQERVKIQEHLFPKGFPKLWVPLLTFYDEQGELDQAHTQAHHDFLSPQVNSFFAAAAPGDGWELSVVEHDAIIKMQLEVAKRRRQWSMIGVLRSGKGEAVEAVRMIATRYAGTEPTGSAEVDWGIIDRLQRRRVTGFLVAPPGGNDLSQEELFQEISGVLELGLPIGICQIPEMTKNEISPETIQALAEQYPSLLFVQDSSGNDLIANSGLDFHGLSFLRGAEGGYADHLKSAGGEYYGYAPGAANCFAREIREIQWMCDNNQHDNARSLAQRVMTVVDHALGLVEELPFGSAVSNATRAIDHIFAFGNVTKVMPAPVTHNGSRIPESTIIAIRESLQEAGFNTELGYVHPELHSPEEP